MSSVRLEGPGSAAQAHLEGLFEVIDGKPVEKLMGAYEVHFTNLACFFPTQLVLEVRLGLVEAEMLFHFGIADQPRRRPDVAYVSNQKWPRDRKIPSGYAWAVVPDLAVEVAGPTYMANEVEEKIVEYLEAGVRLVWVVYPTTSRIYAHDGSSSVRVFRPGDELDGGEILPELRLPLSSLFEDEAGNA